MKKISDRIQGGELLARKVGSGEVGILRGFEKAGGGKATDNAHYWNSKEEALEDLRAVVAYFESDEDEYTGPDPDWVNWLSGRKSAQEAERKAYEEHVMYHFGEARLEEDEEDEEDPEDEEE